MALRPRGQLTSHWLRLDGQESHYLRSTGPEPPNSKPVVLVHGLISGHSFKAVAELLAPCYRVYVPDLPGVGRSEAPRQLPDMSDLVRTFLGWMDACDLDDVHLAGQSFGCNLGVEIAVRHPERVASLTLQALTLEPARRSPVRLLPHWLLSEIREMPKGELKKTAQRHVKARVRYRLLSLAFQHALEERLPKVQCPSLVLHGTHDLVVSCQWAKQAAQMAPNARLLEIPGATHTMNARQPQVYSQALLDFLASIPSTPGRANLSGEHGATRRSPPLG